jgi:hypothetical protein
MQATTPVERDELADRSERCIRKWATAVEDRARKHVKAASCTIAKLLHPYVAISAEAGIVDQHLTSGLAKEFGWECIDSTFVDYIVQHYDWDEVGLDYADESATAWFRKTFGKLCERRVATNPDEYKRPGPVFYLAAHWGSYVFVDPLASFYLPTECGLSVRLVAPKEQRLATIGTMRSCSPQQTAAVLASHDRANADYVKQNFHKNIGDPHLYDLVINLSRASVDSAIDLILGAFLMRFQLPCVTRPFEFKGGRGFQRI